MIKNKTKLDTKEVKRRSVKGVIALVSRQYVLQGLALVANLLFGIFLLPEEYGAFFVVTAVVSFLTYFSDIGLAAALIQKKTKLKSEDLSTTFTIQQVLVLTLVGLAFFLHRLVQHFYSLDPAETYLYFALVISFFLASLKTIPTILLERDLEFDKLIIPQIAENLFFYLTAIILAWWGFGVSSFTVAVLVRGIVGLLVIYAIKPWLPKFSLNKKIAKDLVSFGAPFQLNSILGLVKDDLLISFLGGILSRAHMGYLGWAQKWAKMPLNAFLNSILSVTFPVFSRLQHEKKELEKAINKAFFFVSLAVFPSVLGIIAISPHLFTSFEKYQKWLPTTTAITFFGMSMLISSISTVMTNVLNSLGKVKITLKLMLMWNILTWSLTLYLVKIMGFNGAALAALITSASSFIIIPVLKKYLQVNPIRESIPALTSSLLMFATVFYFRQIIPTTVFGSIILMLLGATTYLFVLLTIFRQKTFQELISLKRQLSKRSL